LPFSNLTEKPKILFDENFKIKEKCKEYLKFAIDSTGNPTISFKKGTDILN
jgi:hypothetical protein